MAAATEVEGHRRWNGQDHDDVQARCAACCDRPSLVGDDKDMLEDLVAAAFNDAVRRAEDVSQQKMASGYGGYAVATGFKLPF